MEQLTSMVTIYTVYALQLFAAIIIGVSVVQIILACCLSLVKTGATAAQNYRMKFAGAIALALELLLGADVLSTALNPGWNDIGQLAAIAAIRTFLNYFLDKELKHSSK